jgi:hypothetical protein
VPTPSITIATNECTGAISVATRGTSACAAVPEIRKIENNQARIANTLLANEYNIDIVDVITYQHQNAIN